MTDEIRVQKQVYITPQDLTGFIVSLGGIKFWAVAIFPMYVGWVLAQEPVAARHLFVDQLGIVLALVVIGPLVGTFTLLFNTYYDMDTTDRVNPRKQYVTVIEDLIDRDTVRYAALGFAGLGLLLGTFVSRNLIRYDEPIVGLTGLVGGHVFFLLIALAAILSFTYSHPLIRFKGVPGMDLLVNILGFGVICPLAGWSLLRPVEAFPAWYLLATALFVGAAYAPTTASDYEADKEYGIRTMAVALGRAGALRVGFALLVAAVVVLFLGAGQGWFPFTPPADRALDALGPFLAAQVVLYMVFMKNPTQSRTWALILLETILQGLTTLLFLYYFVGGQSYAP